MKPFATKRLCRAGVIAALYVALTYAFMPFAFGPFQIRPAEALCVLPLFFPEAIPALYIGCMLSNLTSPYLIYDVFIGSLATLIAAVGTYFIGKLFKKDLPKFLVGGLFPIVCNALIIPLIIVFLCGGAEGYSGAGAAYIAFVFSLFITETAWVYGLGIPLYYGVKRIKKHRLPFLE